MVGQNLDLTHSPQFRDEVCDKCGLRRQASLVSLLHGGAAAAEHVHYLFVVVSL